MVCTEISFVYCENNAKLAKTRRVANLKICQVQRTANT